MPFDDKPMTPHQWPRQPWFVENANVHGNGQLIIFTDGSIADLLSLVKSEEVESSRSKRAPGSARFSATPFTRCL
jgi:hypothetical protein